MKRYAIPIIGAMTAITALSGCVTADQKIGELTASEQFAKFCDAAPKVHTAFLLVASIAEDKIKQSVKDAELKAYTVVVDTCNNPPANVSDALILVANEYSKMLAQQQVTTERSVK